MPKDCDHDSYSVYRRLIGPLRETARARGYALAVHGSLKRDIDLVAAPWTHEAVDARTLAEALRDTARAHNGGIAHMTPGEADSPWFQAGIPTSKPFGRLCWSFHLGGGPYIDLSVMPRDYRGDWACDACKCVNSQDRCWQCGEPRPS